MRLGLGLLGSSVSPPQGRHTMPLREKIGGSQFPCLFNSRVLLFKVLFSGRIAGSLSPVNMTLKWINKLDVIIPVYHFRC